MEDRRPPSKSTILSSRSTASAGKANTRNISCQNCGALRLAQCTCSKMKHIASADKIPQQKPSQPLRAIPLAQQTPTMPKTPPPKPTQQKPKSVAMSVAPLPKPPTSKPLSQQDICLIHNKPLQVVCTMDLTVICSSCAIFGHKGHDFKSIGEFQTDKLKRCQDILELTDAKKMYEEKVASKATRERVERKFGKLREELVRELRFKFEGLQDMIAEAQQKCLTKISKSIAQQQSRIFSLLSLPAPTLQSYKLWQVHAYQQIQAFQNDQQLPLQMKMLNYDKKLSEDIIKRGNTIVNEMKSYYQEVTTKTQQSLTSLSIVFDGEIEKRIEKLPEAVVKRRRYDAAENMVFSSEDLLLEDSKVGGEEGVEKEKERRREEKKKWMEDPVLDVESNCEDSRMVEEQEKLSVCTAQPKQQRRRSLGQELLQLSIQQPTFYNNRQRTCSIIPRQSSTHELPGKSSFAQQRSTLQTRKTQSICIQTQQLPTFSPTPPAPSVPSSMKKKINTIRCSQSQATVSSILPHPNPLHPTTSTLRTVTSPDKLLGWPSVRSILSPSKLKQTTVQTRLKKVLSKLKLPEKYQKLVTSIMSQQIETLDLSNCSIDEMSIVCIIQLLKVNKSVKTLKLIRNRLTDDIVERIIPFIGNVVTVNLAQNYLTERSLDAVIGGVGQLPMMRGLVMSQNRIREKTCKHKLEELKKNNINVTF